MVDSLINLAMNKKKNTSVYSKNTSTINRSTILAFMLELDRIRTSALGFYLKPLQLRHVIRRIGNKLPSDAQQINTISI